MRLVRFVILSCMLFWSIAAAPGRAEPDITGTYLIEGSNPDGSGGIYKGEVAVTASGETYQVGWLIGKDRHRGTGIVTGNVFSVVYQAEGSAAGIAVYKIEADGTLIGKWSNLAGKRLGQEKWTRNKGI